MASSADIISTLLAHGMILERGNQSKPTSGSTNTVLAARATNGCTNPNCKAKKRSTHTTTNCYWPGGGKEGQFPPNFRQRARANAATHRDKGMEYFVLSVRSTDTPGNSGVVIHEDDGIHVNQLLAPDDVPSIALVNRGFRSFGKERIPTFMDSSASNTMFVSKDAFTEYKATPPHTGDSAKAVDGDFEIIGEGRVIQRYLMDGKPKEITYTRALHTPTLSANLILVSAFDRAGLTITFGGGRGIV
jgi:hypothetical protein